MEEQTLKARFRKMEKDREPFLDRAQRASLLTQPALFPPDEHNEYSNLKDPFQSQGSRGVENLTSKMLTALFPPGVVWFKYRLTPEGENAITGSPSVNQRTKGQIDSILLDRAKKVWGVLEQPWFRPRLTELFRHLIVGGNGILQQLPKSQKFRFIPLHNYVCYRDGSDNLLDVIIKERVDPRMLSEDLQAVYEEAQDSTLYTIYERKDRNTFRTWQELGETRVEGSEAEIPEKYLPVLVLRWEQISGEHYGRSFCDKIMGDLATLEGLSESTLEIAAEAARLVYLVDPAGVTNIDDCEQAYNGDYISGREQDVGTMKVDKLQDLQTASALTTDVREGIKQAFFDGETIQRSGERVTAFEIQYLASQLDNALGGTYSLQAEEIQGPILRLTERRLILDKSLDVLPEELVEAKLVTGLEGLGRSAEVQAYNNFDALVAQSIPPEEQMLLFNYHERATRMAVIAGIQDQGYIVSLEDYRKAQQSRLNAQALRAATPAITNELQNG